MPNSDLIKSELTPSPRYLKDGLLYSLKRNDKPFKRADINILAWINKTLIEFDNQKVKIYFSIEVVK